MPRWPRTIRPPRRLQRRVRRAMATDRMAGGITAPLRAAVASVGDPSGPRRCRSGSDLQTLRELLQVGAKVLAQLPVIQAVLDRGLEVAELAAAIKALALELVGVNVLV